MFYFFIKDLVEKDLTEGKYSALPAPIWNRLSTINYDMYWNEWWGLTKDRLKWVMLTKYKNMVKQYEA